MKILFLFSLTDIRSPIRPLQTQQQIQFGISYLSACLKKKGHQTGLVVASTVLDKKNRDRIDRYVQAFRPEVICFTAVATEYPFIADIAKRIKTRYKDIYLLIGGPHASLAPGEALSDDFDAVCIGEGEWPTLELIAQLEKGIPPSGIPNLWIKHGSKIEKNPTRPFLQDLDSLPFPDRDIWQKWVTEGSGIQCSVLLGRGCPFQCSYCCNHALQKLAPDRYVRLRSPDNIIEEIRDIVTRFPATREVYLEVETIGINKKWTLALCEKLERLNAGLDKRLSFGTNLRITPGADYREIFEAFKRANGCFINIGLESGSERVRREILKRYYSNEDVIGAVQLAKRYGLRVRLYNMIGIPGETAADFKETIRVNRLCLPDRHLTSIFFPYPGTELYSVCKAKGFLRESSAGAMERKKSVLDLPDFSRKEIQKNYIWFDYHVYKGCKPMYKILARVFRSALESEYYLNYAYRRLTQPLFFERFKRALLD